jgi:hypothetical protein
VAAVALTTTTKGASLPGTPFSFSLTALVSYWAGADRYSIVYVPMQ